MVLGSGVSEHPKNLLRQRLAPPLLVISTLSKTGSLCSFFHVVSKWKFFESGRKFSGHEILWVFVSKAWLATSESIIIIKISTPFLNTLTLCKTDFYSRLAMSQVLKFSPHRKVQCTLEGRNNAPPCLRDLLSLYHSPPPSPPPPGWASGSPYSTRPGSSGPPDQIWPSWVLLWTQTCWWWRGASFPADNRFVIGALILSNL